MKIWLLFTLGIMLSSPGWGTVKAYLNHNSTTRYTDPYRKIARNGDNLEQVLIDQISQAQKTIYLAVQELRLPLIAKALIEKKALGVDVRVVLENNYNFTVLSQRDFSAENEYEATKLAELQAFVDVNKNGKFESEELESRDAIYMLQKAGVPIIDDTFDTSRGSGLMHHKFVIIDGKSTVVSTANFTLSCIHGDYTVPTSRGNANSMVVVQSAEFARLFTEEYAQLWGNGRRGNFGHNKTYRGPRTLSVRGVALTVQFSPTSQRYNWEESVNGLIAAHLVKARTSIKAALFVFSDQNLANVMESRQQAGAQIGVLIEPNFAYREYSELLDMMGLQLLNQKCAYEPANRPWRVPLREVGMARLPDGDVLHHKFAVVDNKTVVVGSQNWSDAANYINDETLLVIQDPRISDLYAQEYERLKKNSLLGPSSRLLQEIGQRERACAAQGLHF
ncbi:MAG TPA: phospholipase D-like domain-containing protein [Bacteriovoracaceae bacterium]|nr:phospholipase D-like domain-containing protein [Bacteriovoracaceae bacterium]